MNTSTSNFGSTCKASDAFIEKIAKMGVMELACALNQVKANKDAKKTDGVKNKTIRGIPKLVDANYAGSVKSNECTLIKQKNKNIIEKYLMNILIIWKQ